MKSRKYSFLTCLSALGGFLLGATIFNAPQARAKEELKVSVQKIHLSKAQNTGVEATLSGSHVVGFSCTTIHEGAECWIASE